MSGSIYWIDDKQGLFPTGAAKERIEAVCSAEIVPMEATQGTLEKVLLLLEGGESVKLVILDYWLANLPKESDGDGDTKTQFGSTWAAALRADHPELPIVGVTSETIGDVPESQKSQFLQMLNRDRIIDEKHDFDLQSLISDFPTVYQLWADARHDPGAAARIPGKALVDSRSIVSLLIPSGNNEEYLQSVLPEFAKHPWDQETPHEFSRWVIEVLLGRPGFLFDSLELATFLGLTYEGFSLVEPLFNESKYTGIFASNDRPRWWTNQIRPAVEAILGGDMSGPVRENRMKLLEIVGAVDAAWLSKVYTRENTEEIPNCVAFEDESRMMDRRVQCMIEDADLDPLENPPIGFEARRIWRGVVSGEEVER